MRTWREGANGSTGLEPMIPPSQERKDGARARHIGHTEEFFFNSDCEKVPGKHLET
jgi:hypothetical protein